MLEVINASEGGKLTVFKRTFDGITTFSHLWNFDTWGFGYTDVKVLYLPEPMIIAASESGYLYFINSNGELYRHVDLNRPITCLLVTANNTLFAGTEQGQVFHLNGHGEIIAAAKLSDKIIRLEKITEHQIAALSRRGQLAILSVK